MKTRLKENFLNILGIGFSIAFIVLTYYSINLKDFYQALKLPYPWQLLWVPFFDLLVLLTKAIRWKIILQPFLPVKTKDLFELISIGSMGNNILPLKAGEILRGAFLAKQSQKPFSQVLGSIGFEHFFDGIGLLIILIVLSFKLPIPKGLSYSAYVLAIILLGTVILLMVLRKLHIDLKQWEKSHPFFRWPIEFLYHLNNLGKLIQSPKHFLYIIFNTLVIWSIVAYSLIFVHHAFGLSLGIETLFFILLAFNLATAVPSAPGSIGTFEFACVLAYHYLGISKEVGLSLGLYFHMMQFIPITMIGLVFYFKWSRRFKISMGSLNYSLRGRMF